LAEYGVNYNHGGFEARHFHAYAYRAGLFPRILATGRFRWGKRNCVTSVVSLRTFTDSSSASSGALFAMVLDYPTNLGLSTVSGIDRGLESCRKVLERSRRTGALLAPSRMFGELAFFYRATPFIPPGRGFEPGEPVTAPVGQGCGGLGFACESACLSASIDAFHRDHEVAYLSDASASSARDEMSADDVDHADSKILGIYGDVYETADSIASTFPRKLGDGKNAGG
jgi:hypothetical protein